MLGSSTYNLIAKISADTGSLDKGLSGAVGKVSSFKNKLIAIAGTIGLGKIIADSLDQGGQLQQSIGGIETLFGAGGRSVQEYAKKTGKSVRSIEDEYNKMMKAQEIALSNADKAYATVGISANDYMQNVTGFAASLKQSLGGDVVKAANIADMAMVDMADNANKMGTDMGSIQNAYQGFAKQTYTMLDNLKLGYGGTQSEMKRLLKDAQKLSGVKYDIDNLADVYEAIHVIQGELDITGTTAKEATETLEGSANAMKAAFANLQGKIALGESIEGELNALAKTTATWLFGNFIPMVVNILKALPQAIGGFISEAVPIFIQQGKEMFTSLTDGMKEVDVLGTIAEVGDKVITGFRNFINGSGEMLSQGTEIIDNLINGMQESLPKLMETISGIMTELLMVLIESLPSFLASGVDLLLTILDGILSAIPMLLSTGLEIINGLVGAITEALPTLASSGMDILLNLINGIIDSLPLMWDSIMVLIDGIVNLITENLPLLIDKGIEIVGNLISGISTEGPKIVEKLMGFITDVLADIGERLPEFLSKGSEMIVEIVKGIGEKAPTMISDMAQGIKDMIGGIREKLPEFLEKGKEIILKMIDGIIENGPKILAEIVTTVVNIAGQIVKELPQILASGLALALELIAGIISGIPDIVARLPELTGAILEGIGAALAGIFDIGKDLVTGLWNGIKSVTGWIKDKVSGFGKTITNAVKGVFGIKSPSKVWNKEIGRWLPAGAGKGVDANRDSFLDPITSLADDATNAFNPELTAGLNLSSYGNALSGTIGHELGINGTNLMVGSQPAYINLNLGGHEYETYVDDISQKQEQQVQLTLAYQGG